MKCPYCNNEMEKGYVQSSKEVYYTTKPTKFVLLTFPKPVNKDISLSEGIFAPVTIEAWNCTFCKRILIDY